MSKSIINILEIIQIDTQICTFTATFFCFLAALMHGKGYTVGNIDATVIAQRPKLASYIPEMKKNIADALGCDEARVNVKATTEEHLGFTGRGEGIAAHAVCLLTKQN